MKDAILPRDRFDFEDRSEEEEAVSGRVEWRVNEGSKYYPVTKTL